MRHSFDTYRLLDAVDAVDAIRYRRCGPIRYATTCCVCMTWLARSSTVVVLNGRRANQPIWSLAGDLSLELGDLANRLQTVAETLEELMGLAPGEDELFDADGADNDDEEGTTPPTTPRLTNGVHPCN